MNSILQTEKECYISRLKYGEEVTQNLHKHHIFEGTANRKVSEDNGFWVYLNDKLHTGTFGVHSDERLNIWLKQICQRVYEETHSRQEFMDLIGRNYL